MSGARRWTRIGVRVTAATALLSALVLAFCYVSALNRWGRPPYGAAGKRLGWAFGIPEAAYNFDVVIPGRLYRSARPDALLIGYVHDTYGVDRVVSLTGPVEYADAARELGVDVSVFRWSGEEVPPIEEIERVLDIIDEGEPVLVHCFHGQNRTGIAVAAYRVRRQHWSPESAIEEMVSHGYQPHNQSNLRFIQGVDKLLGVL